MDFKFTLRNLAFIERFAWTLFDIVVRPAFFFQQRSTSPNRYVQPPVFLAICTCITSLLLYGVFVVDPFCISSSEFFARLLAKAGIKAYVAINVFLALLYSTFLLPLVIVGSKLFRLAVRIDTVFIAYCYNSPLIMLAPAIYITFAAGTNDWVNLQVHESIVTALIVWLVSIFYNWRILKSVAKQNSIAVSKLTLSFLAATAILLVLIVGLTYSALKLNIYVRADSIPANLRLVETNNRGLFVTYEKGSETQVSFSSSITASLGDQIRFTFMYRNPSDMVARKAWARFYVTYVSPGVSVVNVAIWAENTTVPDIGSVVVTSTPMTRIRFEELWWVREGHPRPRFYTKNPSISDNDAKLYLGDIPPDKGHGGSVVAKGVVVREALDQSQLE